MTLFNYVPVYLKTHRYPLWLTKDLIIYTDSINFNKNIAQNIEWYRSNRNCLYVKKHYVDCLRNMKFYYPDGEMFKPIDGNYNNDDDEASSEEFDEEHYYYDN
uniref:Late expression factor 6 n=1 Tax=Adoxophyes orana granulovirus TaxID=170617 RepID=A0A0A7UYC2_GVAO|nr:late expression factor 6 [Adoxophyes orana granulovirus]